MVTLTFPFSSSEDFISDLADFLEKGYDGWAIDGDRVVHETGLWIEILKNNPRYFLIGHNADAPFQISQDWPGRHNIISRWLGGLSRELGEKQSTKLWAHIKLLSR